MLSIEIDDRRVMKRCVYPQRRNENKSIEFNSELRKNKSGQSNKIHDELWGEREKQQQQQWRRRRL